MSDKFGSGVNRAFEEIIGGILNSSILSILAGTDIIPSYIIWLIHGLEIVGMWVLIEKMSYWATFYIVGWLVGVIILAYSGLITIIDFLMYIIPLVILFIRLFK